MFLQDNATYHSAKKTSEYLQQLDFSGPRLTFRRTMMFLQDNAANHSAKTTSEYLQQLDFSGPRLMKWPACSPDLNSIENLWSLLKRQVYRDGRQFSSKDALWEAILDAAHAISA